MSYLRLAEVRKVFILDDDDSDYRTQIFLQMYKDESIEKEEVYEIGMYVKSREYTGHTLGQKVEATLDYAKGSSETKLTLSVNGIQKVREELNKNISCLGCYYDVYENEVYVGKQITTSSLFIPVQRVQGKEVSYEDIKWSIIRVLTDHVDSGTNRFTVRRGK